ncbi:hypothetical protein FQN55_005993 [Onygenales sp. PD_40]|nr:hypothetical protein FQN55_005993 [Onygenales sp. PD_40]KAK2772840.1 hypothetical protein FQN52_004821 [Onygenales sp. PD_12]KAK2779907.1 hypothetical protein FQN53_001246 [Emmonsiellopsis sp. PD_33]KAK2781762.1 hypothetical protein FQN51_005004 [Onygenales sp. PD_10]
MSNFTGRRAPNFSQYINELNTIPSPYDQAQQQQEQQELFDVDAELALFTNAEFLDFDAVGELPVDMSVKFEAGEGQHDAQKDNGTKYLDMLNDFNLPNYTPDYSSPMLPMQTPAYPLSQPQAPAHHGAPLNAADIRPSIPQQMPAQSPASSTPGSSRKQDAAPATPNVDEAARMAQEEDKRRRNTAASARFRIKKKEREKNMERTVKDVTAKNAALEARINQLETENRWLKNLITEKNGAPLADGDIAGMFDKFRESAENVERRS